MVHNAEIYYVKAESYSVSEKSIACHGYGICWDCDYFSIPNFQIIRPDPLLEQVLVELFHNESGLYTDDILKFLCSLGEPGFEEGVLLKNKLMRLNRKYLDKLSNNGYIVREKIGKRNRVIITAKGKYLVCASGMIGIDY
jgi:predicted transcriptional regulator